MASPTALQRLLKPPLQAFAKTPFGGWFAVTVANPIDRRLLRWSGGRIGLFLGQPVGLLEVRGARSGALRETPLLYAEDGDRVVLVASNAGSLKHPAWFHNLKANPEVAFTARGRRGSYRASEAAGAERDRLWQTVLSVYDGYDEYAERAGLREIPVMVLEPL